MGSLVEGDLMIMTQSGGTSTVTFLASFSGVEDFQDEAFGRRHQHISIGESGSMDYHDYYHDYDYDHNHDFLFCL